MIGARGRIPLPPLLLRDVVPFFDDFRTWNRFLFAGTLALSVVAGVAASWLRAGFVAAPLVLVAFESLAAPYPYFTRVDVNHRAVDAFLRGAPRGPVVEYPLPEVNLLAMYAQGRHLQPVLNGTMSIHPAWFREALPRLGTWPDEAALDLLAEWGVRYVLLNVPESGGGGTQAERRLAESGRVERLGAFDGGFGGAGRVLAFELVR